MKQLKRMIIAVLAFTLLMTGVYADTTVQSDVQLRETMDEMTLNTLSDLFQDAIQEESEGNVEAADLTWNTLLELLDASLYIEPSDELWQVDEEYEYLETLGLAEETLADLKDKVQAAITAEENGDYEEADGLWDAYYAAIDEAIWPMEDTESSTEETWTLDEEMAYLEEFGVDQETINTLKSLYEEAFAAEAAGNQTLSEEIWQAYDDLLAPYFDEEPVSLNAVYIVKNGKLILSNDPEHYGEDPVPQQLTSKEKILHQKMWQRVNQLIPTELLSYIKRLEIGTDGQDGILASVVELDNLSEWSMFLDTKDAVNQQGAFTSDFDFTVLHEIGHVLTLNSSQLSTEIIEGTYNTAEGYSHPESYINAYYQKFWKGKGIDEDTFKQDDFVSDYAMTNIEEDMAETFATFVMEDKATGKQIKDQKVNFFYGYPELVKIRTFIRSQL